MEHMQTQGGASNVAAYPPLSVRGAIARLDAWRIEAEEQHASEVAETAARVAELQGQVTQLSQQLAVQQEFLEELETQAPDIEVEQARRAHDTLLDQLSTQAEAVERRAAQVAAAENARQATLVERVKNSDLADVIEEVRHAEAHPETFDNLPVSYRAAMRAHHDAQVMRIREFLRTADPGPTDVGDKELHVDVVFSLDNPDGAAHQVTVVVPVTEGVHEHWRARGDDLQLWLSTRVVQGMHQAAKALDLGPVSLEATGHRGLLQLQLAVDGRPGDHVLATLAQHLHAALAGAPELAAARLAVEVVDVPARYLNRTRREAS